MRLGLACIGTNLKPGPQFGEILEAVETRQLEGALRDREEALEWVRKEVERRKKLRS